MSESPDAPLIARTVDDALNDDDTVDFEDARAGKVDEGSPGLFVWMLTMAAGISGLLFGCTFRRPHLFTLVSCYVWMLTAG